MRAISSIILGGFVVASLSAQEMTLRSMAAQTHKPVVKAIGTEEPAKSMASLARDASLVVRGTLRPVNTYLSGDGTLIYTDFELTPVAVIAGAANTSQRTPGPAPKLIVRQLGGKLSLEGVDVTVVDEQLNLLPSDQPLLLFLEHIDGESKYRVSGEHWGAFAVTPTGVIPLIRPADMYHRYSGMALHEFAAEITKLRAAAK